MTKSQERTDETLDARKKQARKAIRALELAYPEAACALRHRNPFELAVATILSAQCTDKKVNEVTPALFARYAAANLLARAEPADVERLIRQTGFFRAKTRSIIGMAQALVAEHGGEVPRSLDDLIKLPGIGRKTANVVLGTAFGIPSGIVVDTHVKRLTYRLGLTTAKLPEKIEADLQPIVPRKKWIEFSHRLILHGRAVCTAARPRCASCTMRSFCPRVGVKH